MPSDGRALQARSFTDDVFRSLPLTTRVMHVEEIANGFGCNPCGPIGNRPVTRWHQARTHESPAPNRAHCGALSPGGDPAPGRHADRAGPVASQPPRQGHHPSGLLMDAQDYWLDSILLALVVVLVIVA